VNVIFYVFFVLSQRHKLIHERQQSTSQSSRHDNSRSRSQPIEKEMLKSPSNYQKSSPCPFFQTRFKRKEKCNGNWDMANFLRQYFNVNKKCFGKDIANF
jgi:hypothetical protein